MNGRADHADRWVQLRSALPGQDVMTIVITTPFILLFWWLSGELRPPHLFYLATCVALIRFSEIKLPAVRPYATDAKITLFLIYLIHEIFVSGDRDGILDTGTAWLVAVPVYAAMFDGSQGAKRWSLPAIGSILGVWWNTDPELLAATSPLTLPNYLGVTAMLGASSYLFMTAREQSEADTQAALERIEREVETRRQAEARALAAEHSTKRFLATMSHEIRTPLNGVLGMSELLLDMPLGEEPRELVETIQSSGQVLRTVVDDVLDLAKVQSGRLALQAKPFKLHTLLEDVTALLSAKATAGGTLLVCDVPPGLPAAWVGDASRLRQVLLNLVGNAIKFSPDGAVRLAARLAPGGDLMLCVHDTGVGIPADRLDAIFVPFEQADDDISGTFGGTGLGLSVSKHFVEAMQGQLTVHSVLGEGSRFEVHLPLPCHPSQTVSDLHPAPLLRGLHLSLSPDLHPWQRERLAPWLAHWGIEQDGEPRVLLRAMPASGASRARPVLCLGRHAEGPDRLAGTRIAALARQLAHRAGLADHTSPEDTARTARRATLQPQTVLVVDDNAVNRRVASLHLRRLGFDAIEANSGARGVDLAASHTVAAVLMDLRMPHMDGFEAAQRIANLPTPHAEVPIVALTADVTPEVLRRCSKPPFAGVLTKPIDGAELKDVLHQVTRVAVAGGP